MKLAYIILAHKNPAQVVRLIRRLNVPGKTTFYVHIDKQTNARVYDFVAAETNDLGNVTMLKRYNSFWGGFGIVEATMQGIEQALESSDPFDFIINLSGQDYPIKSDEQIRARLAATANQSYLWSSPLPFDGVHPTKGAMLQRSNRYDYWHLRSRNFYFRLPAKFSRCRKIWSIERSIFWMLLNPILPKKRKFIENLTPYGGGQWWCLCRKHAAYASQYVKENPKFYRYWKYTNISDEMFFQTLLMNSPHKNEIINDDLTLLNIVVGTSHPKVYRVEDFPMIKRSNHLFARKFDVYEDEQILDLLDAHSLFEQTPAASAVSHRKTELV